MPMCSGIFSVVRASRLLLPTTPARQLWCCPCLRIRAASTHPARLQGLAPRRSTAAARHSSQGPERRHTRHAGSLTLLKHFRRKTWPGCPDIGQGLWRQIRQAVQRAQRSGRSGRQRSAGQKTRLDILFLLTGLGEHCSCVSSPLQQGVAVSCLPGLAHHLCGLPGGALAAAALPRLWSPLWGEVLCLLCTTTCSIPALTSLSTVCTGSGAPEASATLSLPAAAAEGMFHTRKHQLQARAAAVGAASPSSAAQANQLIRGYCAGPGDMPEQQKSVPPVHRKPAL